MHHSTALPVESQFLLYRPEQVGIHRLELKTHLVVNAASAFDTIPTFSTQRVNKQLPFLGQRLLRGGSHLGQRQTLVTPRNDMSGRCYIDLDFVSTPFDPSAFVNDKQLRMQ